MLNVSENRRKGLSYCAAKYAALSLAVDIKMVIDLLQLPVTAIIVAISVEDSAAMKAGVSLPNEKAKASLIAVEDYARHVLGRA